MSKHEHPEYPIHPEPDAPVPATDAPALPADEDPGDGGAPPPPQ